MARCLWAVVVLLAAGGAASGQHAGERQQWQAQVVEGRPPAVAADQQPWQYWKTEEGYLADRRLERKLAVWEAAVSIGDLLAAAQEQTGVKLSAFERDLQGQQVTVFARDLPLNTLMVQMAELLGVYWYQRMAAEEVVYTVSYGSSSPMVRTEEGRKQQDAHFRQLRASRIAAYVSALSLSEEELQELGKTDPALAGMMLRYPGTRYGAQALAAFRPETLRRFTDSGDILVGCDDLPASFERAIREHWNPREWSKLGIDSAEMLVKSFRLHFLAPARMLSDGPMYDVWGPGWAGMMYIPGVLLTREAEAPETRFEISYSTGFEPDQRIYGTAQLPGRMEEPRRAEVIFPELAGVTPAKPLGERIAEVLERGEQRRREEATRSPYRDDPKLSKPARLEAPNPTKISDLLRLVAAETGYAVVGTFFDAHDSRLPFRVSDEMPLYVLLSRAARATKCSWALQGTVVRWRHDEWYVYEAEAAGR